jgi:ADP-ribose pyrophosphatase
LGERQLDTGEFLDVEIASLAELEDQARRGELTDAKTLIGLLWLQNWQSGRWQLAWQMTPERVATEALHIMQP